MYKLAETFSTHNEICKCKCTYMLRFSNYINIFSGNCLMYQNVHISNKYICTHVCIQMMYIYREWGNLHCRVE